VTRKVKNRTTTSLIILALVQGPILYHFTSGFFKIFGIIFLGLTGLILTLILFIDVVRNKSTNSKYHIITLIITFIFGLSTVFGDIPAEYLDWTLGRWERNRIVEQVKKGILKPDNRHQTGLCHLSTFLPISNDGNDIDIDENKNGTVYVKFFIDRGFIDHFSAFVYTNDRNEMQQLDGGVGPFGGGVVKKLDTNWYRVSY